MTINELVKEINKLIGIEKTNILIQYVLKVDRKYLIINKDIEVNEEKITKCLELAKKVQEGYPIQYVTNKAYFMGQEFLVNEDVLIPQPDTEVVVMQVLDEIEKIRKLDSNKKIRILDLCTGSGAIAISIANEVANEIDKVKKETENEVKNKIEKNKVSNIEIIATDKSNKALEVAKKNYENINIGSIDFIQSDMFENIHQNEFDIIVSNPPYIETDTIKTLDKEVQCEPKMALDGGKDGLDFYKIIKENVSHYLKKGGLLVLEIGYNQKEKLQELFEGAICKKDFADNDRVILWRN